MKKYILVLALTFPLATFALNIRPEDLEESELDGFSFGIWLVIVCTILVLGIIAGVVMTIQDFWRKKHPGPFSLDKGEYIFWGYASSRCFKESGEEPKANYKGIGNVTSDYIYIKDGKYYYDWCGKFLEVEENPFYGDSSIGEWGTYSHRYKVEYVNTNFCPQGWCYFYFNLPPKKVNP